MKNDAVFIIITYRPEKVALRKLVAQFQNSAVYIIDNTPPRDRTLTNKDFPDTTTILFQEKNTGYAGGASIGLKKMKRSHYKWGIILNDDIDIINKDLQAFLNFLSACPAGIVGPRIGRLDTRRWTTIFSEHQSFDISGDSYVSGAWFAVHRDVIDAIGYFHDPYFIYYEDVEYSIRARKAGFPLYYFPHTTFHHHESQTMKKDSFLHAYYHARNHLLCVERNAPLIVKLYELVRFPKTIYEHAATRNIGGMTGVRDYVLRRFGIYR